MKNTKHIPYTLEFIDRKADLRRSHDELMLKISSDQSVIIPTSSDLNLIDQNSGIPKLVQIAPSDILIEKGKNHVFLGKWSDKYIFNSDYSHLGPTELNEIKGEFEFIDLRAIGSQLSSTEASLAVYARGLQYWHKTHRFCSRCATETIITEGGHSRTCTNADCNHITYPRISPAVIVLVEHYPTDGSIPKCLLGKGNRSWENIRSTLAGFVEVGESLEETVKREMEEEAGIRVHNIRYMGSQPWPFPSSLMVGFFAETDDMQLRLDSEEILEAGWYTIEEIKKTGSIRRIDLVA